MGPTSPYLASFGVQELQLVFLQVQSLQGSHIPLKRGTEGLQ